MVGLVSIIAYAANVIWHTKIAAQALVCGDATAK